MSVAEIGIKNEVGSEVEVRQQIIDAALAIALRGREIPTPENIAERTGLAVKRVTAIYPGLDELADDIKAVSAARYAALEAAMPAVADLGAMLDELVQLRAAYYETVGELRVLADAGEGFLPSLMKDKAVREGKYRGRLSECFEVPLGRQVSRVLPKIELLTSWESWRHLRSVQCLTKEQSVQMVRTMLRDVIGS
ncbi:MAG: hypothetical protein RLN89_13760 [Parvibaculum sp.]